jgi:hypothetical protein
VQLAALAALLALSTAMGGCSRLMSGANGTDAAQSETQTAEDREAIVMEGKASRYFEAIRDDPVSAAAFLRQMPKGSNLRVLAIEPVLPSKLTDSLPFTESQYRDIITSAIIQRIGYIEVVANVTAAHIEELDRIQAKIDKDYSDAGEGFEVKVNFIAALDEDLPPASFEKELAGAIRLCQKSPRVVGVTLIPASGDYGYWQFHGQLTAIDEAVTAIAAKQGDTETIADSKTPAESESDQAADGAKGASATAGTEESATSDKSAANDATALPKAGATAATTAQGTDATAATTTQGTGATAAIGATTAQGTGATAATAATGGDGDDDLDAYAAYIQPRFSIPIDEQLFDTLNYEESRVLFGPVLELGHASRIDFGFSIARESKVFDIITAMREASVGVTVHPVPVAGSVRPSATDVSSYWFFQKNGIGTAVTSDNGKDFSTDLCSAWVTMAQSHRMGYADLKQMAYASLDLAFLDDEEKAALKEKLDAAYLSFERGLTESIDAFNLLGQ